MPPRGLSSHASSPKGSHSAQRCCVFCGKSFSRSDAALRHSRTCPSRGTWPVPSYLKRGKKRKACDRCAGSKLSCDLEYPCESCLINRKECSYKRVAEDNVGRDLIPREEHDPQSKVAPPAKIDISRLMKQLNSKVAIPFLLNYTDPLKKEFHETFGRLSTADPEVNGQTSLDDALQNDHLIVDDEYSFYPLFPCIADLPLISTGLLAESQSETSTPISDLSYDERTHTHNCLPLLSRERSVELIDHLTFLALSISKDVPEFDPANSLAQGLTLLEPGSVQKYVTLYFREWHQHSPVIHKATFDPNYVPLPLLLTMVLIGALYSSSRENTDKARDMLFLAEKLAYSDPVFNLLLNDMPSLEDFNPRQCLQATQAAFLVMQIQLREGGPEKKKQARSDMFDKLVKAIRSMSLLNARTALKPGRFSSLDEFNWQEVALAESQIRQAIGIFNLDATFCVFYSMPPRFQISELLMDMPCSTSTYLAPTAEECYHSYRLERKTQIPVLAKLVEIYFLETWTSHEEILLDHLTVLHHFILILAILHSWVLRSISGTPVTAPRTKLALERWKRGWDMCMTSPTREDLQQTGCMKDAGIEFWHVAKEIVKRTR